jgi:general secretion pathway protein D
MPIRSLNTITRKTRLLFFSLLLCTGASLYGQEIKEMRFTNQPITDILLALGEISGNSIVPDETVKGSASYYFAETDFETALQVFLGAYKMYYRKEGNVYYVSRISTGYDPDRGTLTMDAEDVEILYLIRSASKAMGKTILYDPLPAQPLTVHVQDVEPEKFLDIIVKRFTDFTVESDDDYYYIKRIPQATESRTAGRPAASGAFPGLLIERKGDLYSIDVEKGRFQEVIDALFLKADLEYSMLMRKDLILDRLRFSDKDFDQLLRLILEQAAADYTVVGEVYYLFEIQQKDVLNKFVTNIRIPLTYIPVKELVNLLPADLSSSRLYKLDTTTNSLILSGSLEEIGPVQKFIRQIDRPLSGLDYHRFDLSYLDPAKIQTLLPAELKYIEPIVVPATSSFVALVSEENRQKLEQYLALIDRPEESVMIKLKYIKAEELEKKLPPSISKDEIISTNDPSTIFVKTSAKKLQDLYRELKVLDRPVPQIRYQILVIQSGEGDTIDWSNSIDASTVDSGSQYALVGTVGKLLSLNFDVISSLGYQFALKLNLSLSENRARVLADTTLLSLSDNEVSFQNTETYRYREIEVDEDGNVKYTGVTREITAGLIFTIKGWISADNMITMNVKATVSKRGTDTSTTTGSLPPTSEHIVNTQVRTFSGEPVVIGGLIRQEKNSQVSRVPVLGHIPLLGLLFQTRKDSVENSELTIYIIPHLEYSELEEADLGLRLDTLYRKFRRTLRNE